MQWFDARCCTLSRLSFIHPNYIAGAIIDSRSAQSTSDVIVVGGGLVGAAIATGLLKKSLHVTVLDGGDTDYRSSRGNFGLVWVQGKGAGASPYARWTGSAAAAWPEFAQELLSDTGIDVQLQQTGGIDYCLTESEFTAREAEMQKVREHTDHAFEFQMLDNKALRELQPQVSDRVYGASFSPQDGHVNPLKLLQALHVSLQKLGGSYLPDHPVVSIEPVNTGFKVRTHQRTMHCKKLVLAAGLANTALAEQLNMRVPLRPNQGQLLITERVEPFLSMPSIHIRQTDEGTLQIGDSHADVGMDDSTSMDVLAMISKRLLQIFPHLAGVNVLRCWSALRVLTPDGLPVYERSSRWPNAYAINCHSGVTLAAQHASVLSDWISNSDTSNYQPMISEFSSRRFSDV